MDVLLDTHSFIWFVENDKKLTSKARNTIDNYSNTIYISRASLWEMAIKISIRKLKITVPYENVIKQINDNGFEIIPITFVHTLKVSKLEFHHKDPFDRIIIAQALTNQMTIVSNEKIFDNYKVKRIWK